LTPGSAPSIGSQDDRDEFANDDIPSLFDLGHLRKRQLRQSTSKSTNPAIVSLNPTSVNSAWAYITSTNYDVYFLQELLTSPAQAEWLCNEGKTRGLQIIFAPSNVTPAGGLSAGVLIAVRTSSLIVRDPEVSDIVFPGRVVAGVVAIRSLDPVLAVCAYFKDGIGFKGVNLKIAAAISKRLRLRPMPWIIAGDFNIAPQELELSGWLRAIDGVIIWLGPNVPTYVSGDKSSCKDFFIVSRGIVGWFLHGGVDSWATIKKHVPVYMTLRPVPPRTHLVKQREKPLGVDFVFGPQVALIEPEPALLLRAKRFKQQLIDEQMISDIGHKVLHGHERDVAMAEFGEVHRLCANAIEGQMQQLFAPHELKPLGRGLKHKYKTLPVHSTSRAALWFTNAARATHWIADCLASLAAHVNKHASEPNPIAAEHLCRVGCVLACRIKRAARPPCESRPHGSPFRGVTDELGHLATGLAYLGRAAALATIATRILRVGHTGTVGANRHLPTWQNRVSALASEIIATAGVIDSAEVAKRQSGWREWISVTEDPSASRAHKWTSALPDSGPVEGVLVHQRVIVLSESQVIGAEANRWGHLWEETTDYHLPFLPSFLPLGPPITGADVQSAALTFKKRTCVPDGLHPRHFGLISPSLAHAVADLFMSAEAFGDMPEAKQQLEIGLIPKPSSGMRTIGCFDSLYRVLQRVRKPLLNQWQSAHDRPYWSSDCGRGAQRVAWRQAVQAEAATLSGLAAVALMTDLWKCFDTAIHSGLLLQGKRFEYPLGVLTLSMSSYRWGRRLSHKGSVSRIIFPTIGLVAGSVGATYELKSMLIDTIDTHLVSHPTVRIEVLVDDILQAVEDPSEDVAVITLTNSARDLALAIRNDAGFIIADSKTVIVANSDSLGQKLKASLGKYGGAVSRACRFIGADYSHGRGVTAARRAKVTTGRWTKAAVRSRRLGKVARTCRRTACRIISTGIMPSVAFAAPVVGASRTELDRAKKMVGRGYGTLGRGKSNEIGLLVLGPGVDPTAKLLGAPLKMLVQELWGASNPGLRREFMLPVSLMAIAIRSSIASGDANSGPIGLAVDYVRSTGIKWATPFALDLPDGTTCNLRVTPPTLVLSIVQVWSEVARAKVLLLNLKDEGNGDYVQSIIDDQLPLYAGHIKAALGSKALSALEKVMVLSCFQGGSWTNCRLERHGMIDSPLCEFCGMLDTLHHRIWTCTHTEHLLLNVPAWVLRNVRAAPVGAPRYTRLLARNPARLTPPAPVEPRAVWTVYQDGVPVDLDGVPPPFELSNEHVVAGDGSAVNTRHAWSRATWAVAIGSKATGNPLYCIRGTVPGPLPQNSSIAEHYSLAAALLYTVPHPQAGNVLAVWDNQGVVDAYRQGVTPTLAKMAKHAGLWRSISAPGPSGIASFNMCKVKSHQVLADVYEETEKVFVTINAVADHAATLAHELFPPFPEEAKLGTIEKAELKIIAIHTARALALFVKPGNPTPSKNRFNFEMVPRGRRYAKPVDSSHALAFDFGAKRWVCQSCRCTFAPGKATNTATKPCQLLSVGLRSILADRRVNCHRLWMAEDQGKPFLFCVRCHGFSSGMRRKLGAPCNPASAAAGYGVTAGKRFRANRHPTHGGPITRPEPVPDDSQVGCREVSEFTATPVASADGCDLMQVQSVGALPFSPNAEDLPAVVEGVYSDEEDPFSLGPVSP
jgi:hypothetical protein